MGCLEYDLGKQHAIISDDPNGISPDTREPTYNSWPVKSFEFMEPARINDPVNDLTHIVSFSRVLRDDIVDLFRVVVRIFRFGNLAAPPSRQRNRAEDVADDAQCIRIVLCIVISHSRDAAVYVGAAKLF